MDVGEEHGAADEGEDGDPFGLAWRFFFFDGAGGGRRNVLNRPTAPMAAMMMARDLWSSTSRSRHWRGGGELVEVEVGEEEEDAAGEEEDGDDPLHLIFVLWEEGLGEEGGGEAEGHETKDVVHPFGVAEIFIGLAGGEGVEVFEGENGVGVGAGDRGAVLEDDLAAKPGSEGEEGVPEKTDGDISSEFAAIVRGEEETPGKEDEAPGGEVGEEFVEFDGVLGDVGAARPDFGVDAADEGEEEPEGAGGGGAEGGPAGAGGFVDQAGEIEEESGKEKHKGELDKLWVEVAEELPERMEIP